jgi:DNA-3-methyladenine glycosylase
MSQRGMEKPLPLPRAFYDRPTLTVARELLGKRLVRNIDGSRVGGIICETEAYVGQDDLGCHAKAGLTRRNAVMFGPPGHAYVYFTYGMHWMLNAVTEGEGFPAAVLIRGFVPVEGLEVITGHRQGKDTFGPAKLTQALGIDGNSNGLDLCDTGPGLWIEAGVQVEDKDVVTGPRVGLFTVPEPWKSIPWRFRISADNLARLSRSIIPG